MEPRISLVTLGVADLDRALRFYRDGLGWEVSSASSGDVAFLRTSGAVLGLYPRAALAEDAHVSAEGTGFAGFALAHNVPFRDEVDQTLAAARAAGARIAKEAEDAFWGGRSGYFADPDGFLWEVAWNLGFPLRADGTIDLP